MIQHTLTLKWFPAELRPNARVNVYKKNSIFQQYKKYCRQEAVILQGLQQKPIAVTLLFTPPDNRRRDLDNCLAACKAMLDGISDAIGVDDRYFHPITIDWGDGDKGTIEIILHQCD